MSRGLLVLWIATLGADRIDLLAGAGPLMLRPLLLLIPPLVVVELVRLGRRDRSIIVPPSAAMFFVAHTMLLAVLLLSVMYSQEVGLGARRFALVAFDSYAAFLVAIFLLNRSDARLLLVRGAQLGLALIVLFNAVQVSRWSGGPAFDWLSFGGIVDLTPATYGPWLPRPSGVSLDPNRGGVTIIVYLAILAAFASASRWRSVLLTVGVLLLLVTLSRSAILAASIIAVVSLLQRGIVLSHSRIALTATAIAAGAAALLVSPGAQQGAVGLLDILGHRLSMGEGSTSVHLALLRHGWDISTSSVRNPLLGIGFGNSYLVLQEFFPGTKYGNFHSAYVSLLVESGAAALVVFLVLMFRPLVQTSKLTPLVAGLLGFNIFYQSHVDAILWFVLALAWMLPDLALRQYREPRAAAVRAGVYDETELAAASA